MERCPNCSARLSEAPNCRRCGMDLSRLLETEQAAEQRLVQGLRHLLDGDQERARHALVRSLALRDTPLTRELLCFLAGLDAPSGIDERQDSPNREDPMSQETLDPTNAWTEPGGYTQSSGDPLPTIISFSTDRY